MPFKPVSSQVDFPALEEETLKYWKKNKIFEKSVESRPANKTWTFLDGPPFVTGMPHYGTLLSSIPKDLFGRYWTMKGYRVRRVWGWDGHGLPIENKVENKLKLKRKRDIEDVVGVKKFIDECLGYVQEVSAEWEWYVDHIARWVDFKNAYRTWDLPYMESVMWVFKQIYDKGYIYKGLRVSLYCPHCVTPISNFEVAMDADNYKDIVEPSNVYKYQSVDDPQTFFLAWSTTPWTKISTPALAVNPKLTYVKVQQGDEFYILAKKTLSILLPKPEYKIVAEFSGKTLVGQKFVGHFDFFKHEKGKKVFEIIGGGFVTATEGTGIVTIAAYGEEDLEVMNKSDVQVVLHLDDEGKIKPEVGMWAGEFYLKVNPKINEYLANKGLVYRQDEITHSVPTCWRCHERLIYAPQNAWYINIQKLKPQLVETNEKINWFPEHFKHGRFLNSLMAAPDWCISRSRYWGSPVPVWECAECGSRFVPGSIAELEEASGKSITNLHKPGIDEVEVKCQQCGKKMKRTPEVLDSWVEAGSASFAERHFPFAKGIDLKDFFPPDFIVEYTGQIRAWFYVLHVITNSLYKSIAFKNVSVTGVILGTDGRKMSKNFGNYPDPKEMLLKHGGDALRLYLLGSPVMNGEDIRISEKEYNDQVRTTLLILWNVYSFFVTYSNIDGWTPEKVTGKTSANILDRWILSRMNGSIKNMINNGYEKFNTPEIVGLAKIFIVRDLSLWYVRRIRDRVGPTSENTNDKNAAYETLWTVLQTYSRAIAPVIPFISEEIYRNLTAEESVHLSQFPSVGPVDEDLESDMEKGIELAGTILALRKIIQVPVKIPLRKVPYKSKDGNQPSDDVLNVVKAETNVYELDFHGKGNLGGFEVGTLSDFPLSVSSEENLDREAGLAREIVRQIQEARKVAGTALAAKVVVHLPDWPKEFEEYIKKQTLATKLVHDSHLHITS